MVAHSQDQRDLSSLGDGFAGPGRHSKRKGVVAGFTRIDTQAHTQVLGSDFPEDATGFGSPGISRRLQLSHGAHDYQHRHGEHDFNPDDICQDRNLASCGPAVRDCVSGPAHEPWPDPDEVYRAEANQDCHETKLEQ